MNLPHHLTAWRTARKMTQERAAKHLGVNLRTWQNWECGRYRPRGLALKTLLNETKKGKK